MIAVTTPSPRRPRTPWLLVGAGIGLLAVVACAGVLAATHGPAIAELTAAARSALGRGCAELSCVLDAGADRLYLVSKVGATALALVRALLALG